MKPLRWSAAAACLALILFALLGIGPTPAQETSAKTVVCRIYGSILTGLSEREAVAYTQPTFDYMGQRLGGYEFKVAPQQGKSHEHLMDLGRKLDRGDVHLAAMWGVEYGLLRQRYKDLRVCAVVSTGSSDAPTQVQVYVRTGGDAQKFGDLKNKRLALYKDMSLMDKVYLNKMILDEGGDPRTYFRRDPPYPTVVSALSAVARGESGPDCIAMGNNVFFRRADLQPGIKKLLRPVGKSPEYPKPVIVGSPRVLDRLGGNRSLWKETQALLIELHRTKRGEELVGFWRIQSFVQPDAAYEAQVEKAVKSISPELLTTSE